MENSQEIATTTVQPISFDKLRKEARGGLVIKHPNTKLALRLLTGLSIAAVAAIAWLGVYLPLAVYMPENKAAIAHQVEATAELNAINAQEHERFRNLASSVDNGYYGNYLPSKPDTREYLSNILDDECLAIFSTLLSGGTGITCFRRLKRRRQDIHRLVASLPGSTCAFILDNMKRAADLETRCADFDRRLKAFVDGKMAFNGLEEQYEAAMAQFVAERLTLDAEAGDYLNDIREAVALDRRRLKFVNDCRALAEISQMLEQSPTNVYKGDTRHVSQGIAGAALARRLEQEQEVVGMPKRFLTAA